MRLANTHVSVQNESFKNVWCLLTNKKFQFSPPGNLFHHLKNTYLMMANFFCLSFRKGSVVLRQVSFSLLTEPTAVYFLGELCMPIMESVYKKSKLPLKLCTQFNKRKVRIVCTVNPHGVTSSHETFISLFPGPSRLHLFLLFGQLTCVNRDVGVKILIRTGTRNKDRWNVWIKY